MGRWCWMCRRARCASWSRVKLRRWNVPDGRGAAAGVAQGGGAALACRAAWTALDTDACETKARDAETHEYRPREPLRTGNASNGMERNHGKSDIWSGLFLGSGGALSAGAGGYRNCSRV